MQSKLGYLNLGCGSRFHPNWTNIDIVSTGPGVIAHDLMHGIPMPDNACEVVYHSSLLEHLRPNDALPFLQECHRVLKSKGILRVATPDLECICRVYLEKLTAALDGDIPNSHDYNWIMLEMYDQTVREHRGGEMLAYLRQDSIPNEAFVYSRIGEDGQQIVKALKQPMRHALVADHSLRRWADLLKKLMQRTYAVYERMVAHILLRRDTSKALDIGRFRLSGEVHRWMYDRYSLRRLLVAAGFCDINVQTATMSRIPDWTSFCLDTTPDGRVNKPDSLFMEGIKIT